MPADLLASVPQLAVLFEAALDGLGWGARMRRGAKRFSLRPRSERGMRCAHVGTVAFSWALTQLLASSGVLPDVIFGHSLGLHSALAASGAARIGDTLDVVDRTASFLMTQHGGEALEGTMLVVAGFTADELARLCDDAALSGAVYVAVVNSHRQVVVSGARWAIDRLARRLRAKQAWALRRLPARLPLHTPLMEPLAEQCARLVAGCRCHVPHVPLVDPTTGAQVRTVSGVERLWRTHLLGTIDFVRCLERLESMGVATYVEVGLGRTLTRISRWNKPNIHILSVGWPDVLADLLDASIE